ncbi:uncharacterized protein O3C94_002688 [Discoglossus pictus]
MTKQDYKDCWNLFVNPEHGFSPCEYLEIHIKKYVDELISSNHIWRQEKNSISEASTVTFEHSCFLEDSSDNSSNSTPLGIDNWTPETKKCVNESLSKTPEKLCLLEEVVCNRGCKRKLTFEKDN